MIDIAESTRSLIDCKKGNFGTNCDLKRIYNELHKTRGHKIDKNRFPEDLYNGFSVAQEAWD